MTGRSRPAASAWLTRLDLRPGRGCCCIGLVTTRLLDEGKNASPDGPREERKGAKGSGHRDEKVSVTEFLRVAPFGSLR
jgi:hypothetical protein